MRGDLKDEANRSKKTSGVWEEVTVPFPGENGQVQAPEHLCEFSLAAKQSLTDLVAEHLLNISQFLYARRLGPEWAQTKELLSCTLTWSLGPSPGLLVVGKFSSLTQG